MSATASTGNAKETHSFTRIEIDETEAIFQCDDCGAYAASQDQVVHHASCRPGESERWMRFYGEEE